MVNETPEVIAQDLRVVVAGAELAGTIWTPRHGARSVVLMLPGSGRATRNNDDYFPLVRDVLLRAGHATASFDKRGVGGSTGSYHENTIAVQVEGATACAAKLQDLFPKTPLGLFGHSQGGWVAIELAARCADVAYLVSNSGPAVGPALQERARRLNQLDPSDHECFVAAFDQLVDAARQTRPFGQVKELLRSIGVFEELMSEYLHDGPSGWNLERALLAYDPSSALGRLTVPTLVLHGGLDDMVSVDDSVAALTQLNNGAITTEILHAGDHRLRTTAGALVDDYAATLASFIDDALQ